MMKISKAALTNEFILSPVQFTSLNSVAFKNIKSVYDGNEKILLEYEHSLKIEASSRDWIGIFPRGWSTLQQYVTFEWVSQSLPCGNNDHNKENGDLIRRTISFSPKYHMNSVNNNSFYQFVYISKQIEVLGVSSYFRFDLSCSNDANLELECLVPASSKLRSTSVSDFGILLANNVPSSTSLDTRTLQTTSIHSLQNLDIEGKTWTKSQVPMNMGDLKKSSVIVRKAATTNDVLNPYSSHSEPVFPMSLPVNHCKKCFHFKRGGDFIRSQQVLQSKVGPQWGRTSELNGQRRTLGLQYLSEDKLKIVMERNKVLEERVQEMKKEMERLQGESKKLKTSFFNVNKEKVAYEKFVKDFIKSLEKDSIVRVVNGNTEILVKKVNYVGMEEHPRDKKTSKRERELKAVIGLQEITIRNLINSLQEKAKSVPELGQTVKLAQAFSAARDDSREYGSDAEEEALEEVNASDVTSEYEFSLSKPPPPEEVTVEDADAVLNDIRRATEMELKDIGINRSLGKNSSRDSLSDSGLPNLSVRSYQNQNEGTRPKKPRLFDNVEDCWPFSDNRKTVHRKVLESYSKIEDRENIEDEGQESNDSNNETDSSNEEQSQNGEGEPPETVQTHRSDKMSKDYEPEPAAHDDYFDAYEALSSTKVTSHESDFKEKSEPSETQKMDISNENVEESKNPKKNFLITAIIPQDLDVKPVKATNEWGKIEEENVVVEKKSEPVPEKPKKFTCELMIDFTAKRVQHQEPHSEGTKPAIEYRNPEESNPYGTSPSNSEAKQEKSMLTFNKSNKCLEIKITQVDQKENLSKNYVHQKMVVKFGKDSQPETEASKKSKFEFNLAVGGRNEENEKLIGEGSSNLEFAEGTREEIPTEGQSVFDASSPRTIWNDAIDNLQDSEDLMSPKEAEEVEERESEKSETSEELTEEICESLTNVKSNEDSLRYEKNLEFFQQQQQKKDDKMKEDKEVAKDKPSAILIQNGQTKLALIRYQ